MASKSKRVTFLHKPSEKKENSTIGPKVKVRNHCLNALGSSKPMILDVFCAHGEMWINAYHRTPHYLGLDLKQFDDERRTVVCNNARYLRCDGNLSRFDVFDLDAYGSPALQLATICQRIGPLKKPVAVAITEGCGYAAAMNSLPVGLLAYLGLKKQRGTSFEKDNRKELIKLLVQRSADACRAVVKDFMFLETARQGGNSMIYCGYVMEPRSSKV